MYGIETHDSFLPVILLVIGIGLLLGAMLFIWTNRHNDASRRNAKRSVPVALVAGGLAASYWAVAADKPNMVLGTFVIIVLVIAPVFVLSYFLFSFTEKKTL